MKLLRNAAALALSAALLAGSALAITPEEAFPDRYTYPGFIDVAADAWYADAAKVCAQAGLMQGTGHAFAPDEILTVGEVAAIAARMNEAITGQAIPMAEPKAGEELPWYFSYVIYLEKLGITVPDPTKHATRQEFVSLLAAVVPEDMLSSINTITVLPDTSDPAVLRFYNAGILTGVDDMGTFAPEKTLTRAECGAMVARIAPYLYPCPCRPQLYPVRGTGGGIRQLPRQQQCGPRPGQRRPGGRSSSSDLPADRLEPGYH